MFRRFTLTFAKICLLLVLSLSLTGCMFDYDSQNSNGIPLSAAMKASASGGGQVSGGHSEDTVPSIDVDARGSTSGGDGGGGGGGGDFTLVDYGDQTYAWQMPMDVSYSVPLNGEIQSLTRFTLTPIAVENDHHFAGLFVSGDIVDLQPGSLPDQAVKNTWMLEGGISYRYYFTPAHTFFSPYFSANVAFQELAWEYRNPIIVNGQTITGDSLPGVGGYVGLGLAIKRNSYLSVFGEAGFGGTVFSQQTNQGFDNDVFSNFGYFSVKAGLSIKF